jgi:hypothetical protein
MQRYKLQELIGQQIVSIHRVQWTDHQSDKNAVLHNTVVFVTKSGLMYELFITDDYDLDLVSGSNEAFLVARYELEENETFSLAALEANKAFSQLPVEVNSITELQDITRTSAFFEAAILWDKTKEPILGLCIETPDDLAVVDLQTLRNTLDSVFFENYQRDYLWYDRSCLDNRR